MISKHGIVVNPGPLLYLVLLIGGNGLNENIGLYVPVGGVEMSLDQLKQENRAYRRLLSETSNELTEAVNRILELEKFIRDAGLEVPWISGSKTTKLTPRNEGSVSSAVNEMS